MRVFVTGATGFIGGHAARKLRERGDDVVALVRDRSRAGELESLGCELVEGDLGATEAIAGGLADADAAIHGAAIYKVGVPTSDHPRMYEANVLGTERVLEAALDADTPRVVYVSTVAVFGNTRGRVVDETYEHPGDSFTSYYEQTKYEAHRIAKRLIEERDLPAVIVQPGSVYGPGDHSVISQQMKQFLAGRMPLVAFPETGFTMVHVEDVADGILLALDRGEIGRSYVLGGEVTTMRGLFETLARVDGRKPPRGSLPTPLLKAAQPIGGLVGKLMGQPPNLRELISSADGVTFWAGDERARSELGYAPRDLETGLRETLAAERGTAARA